MKKILFLSLLFVFLFPLSVYGKGNWTAEDLQRSGKTAEELNKIMENSGWTWDPSVNNWVMSSEYQRTAMEHYQKENEYTFTADDFDQYGNPKPETYGKGLSASQCTAKQLEMRRRMEEAYDLGTAEGFLFHFVDAIRPDKEYGLSDFVTWLHGRGYKSDLISSGGKSYYDILYDEIGYNPNDIINSSDFGDPGHSVVNFLTSNASVNPELLNIFQEYIDSIKEEHSDTFDLYCYDVDKLNIYTSVNYNNLSDAQKGEYLFRQNYIKKLLMGGKLVWYASKYYQHPTVSNARGNYTNLFWTDGPASDYTWYVSYDGGNEKRIIIRRKDNQPFLINRTVFGGTGGEAWPVLQDEYTTYGSNIYDSYVSGFRTPITGGPYNGFITTTGKIRVYKSAGHLSSAMTYGPQISPVIQKSGDHVYDQSMTINGDQIKNYDYSTIINNINSEPGMNPDELQKRIDEVLTEMGAISGNTEDIKENTELQVSWLRKIYDKLCDVYDKIGGGLSTGQFLEWEWLQVKLDAIIALLGVQTLSDWADDATDLVSDVTDIGTDIGDAIVLKFPFCLPWDMMLILNALKSIPETPVFEIPVDIDSWNLHETITLDLSDFQILSDVAKWFFDVLYGFAITKLTLKILQVEIVGTSG